MENLSDYVKEIIGLVTAIISLIGVTISLITVLIVYRREPKKRKSAPKNTINISTYNIKKIILPVSYDTKKQSSNLSTIYAVKQYKKTLKQVKSYLDVSICTRMCSDVFFKKFKNNTNSNKFKKIIDSIILENNTSKKIMLEHSTIYAVLSLKKC